MEILLLILIVFIVLSVAGSLAAGLVGLIIGLLIWMFIGFLTGRLVRGRGYGPIGDILLGLVGGWVGSFIMRATGLDWGTQGGLIGTIVAGVIGALLVVGLIHVVTRN